MNVIADFGFALIVDDDPDSQMLVAAMLEYAGYAKRQALTFEEAHKELDDGPLCVILDVVMPGNASELLCDQMVSRSDDTPVILMSSQPLENLSALREAWRDRGLNVVAVLCKPFWLDRLLEALNVAIPAHRADRGIVNDPLG